MIPYNDLSRIHKDIDFVTDIQKAIDTNSFIGSNDFAKDFSNYTKSKYCLPCANGTDALTIAIMAMNFPEKTRIAVPAISYAATAMAVVSANHIPVFIDVDPDTGLIDLDKLEKEEVKCVIPVHLYGQCVDVSKIKIPFIEDCAQAHSATIDNIHVGNFGTCGCFSFYPGKNLGAMGDAGCIITNDIDFYKRCKSVASLGASEENRYLHLIRGMNSRMDSFQGLILQKKLLKLDEWTEDRIKIGKIYDKAFGIKRSNVGKDVYHVYFLKTKNRDEMIKYLNTNNIQHNIHYPYPLNKLQCFDSSDECPNAERFCKECISIPLFPGLTNEEVSHIVKTITQY